jgi:hypothetical protein
VSDNHFDRVRMWALQNDAGDANFDISAPVEGVGAPLDWITFTGEFSSAINSGVRKVGANLITLTQLGSDAGYKDVISAGNISWTGGEVAGSPVADGSTGGVGLTQQTQTVGNGMRLEVTIGTGPASGLWPDALLLRVIDLCYSVPRQVTYEASIQGDPDAVSVVENIGKPETIEEDPNVDAIAPWKTQVNHRTDFIFASEVPGAVARLDLTRAGGSMGNWALGYAVMLYRAPRNIVPSRGGVISSALRSRT